MKDDDVLKLRRVELLEIVLNARLAARSLERQLNRRVREIRETLRQARAKEINWHHAANRIEKILNEIARP
jgi:hypothetical protein